MVFGFLVFVGNMNRAFGSSKVAGLNVKIEGRRFKLCRQTPYFGDVALSRKPIASSSSCADDIGHR